MNVKEYATSEFKKHFESSGIPMTDSFIERASQSFDFHKLQEFIDQDIEIHSRRSSGAKLKREIYHRIRIQRIVESFAQEIEAQIKRSFLDQRRDFSSIDPFLGRDFVKSAAGRCDMYPC